MTCKHSNGNASCHCAYNEGIWGSGGIVPLIPNLATGWASVVNVTLQLLYPQKKDPWYPTNWGLRWAHEPVWTL
jgi:hypothetical protein